MSFPPFAPRIARSRCLGEADAGQLFAQQLCGDASIALDDCIAQVCPDADTACLLGFCPEGSSDDACLSQLDLMRVAEDDPTATLAPLRIGMQVTPYNETFLLNIMHFLDGLL